MRDLYQIAKILKSDIVIQGNIALLEYIEYSTMRKDKNYKIQVFYYLPTILSKEPFLVYREELKNIKENYKITNTPKEIIIKDNIGEVKIYKKHTEKIIELVKDYENVIEFSNLNNYFQILFNLIKSKENVSYKKIGFNFKSNELVATTGYSLFIFHNIFPFQIDLDLFGINSKVIEIISYLNTDFTLYYSGDKFKIKAKNVEIIGNFEIFPNYEDILNDLSKKEYLKPIKVNKKDLIKYVKEVGKEYDKYKVFCFYINNKEVFIEDLNKERKIKIADTDNEIEYRNYFVVNYLVELIKDLKDKEIEILLPVEVIKDDYTGDPLKILSKDYSILLMPIKVE